MERKLSQKALRMRQRFTFSRDRDRAATIPPAGATSAPNSRPRSATTPISSHTITDTATSPIDATYQRDSIDRIRCYHFTDEPGYFRPASPLIYRQSVPEELEDDIKQACALLVQSVDRGVPIWPSSKGGHGPSTTKAPNMTTARIASPEAPSRFYNQRTSTSRSAVDHQMEIHTDDKMHDSGVAFQHSAAASGTTGRFYGSRHSSSRHGEHQNEEPHRGRSYSRSRGQSLGTDATPSRSRSRSLSPDMFPYSPPQVDTLWPHVKDMYSPSDAFFPDTETETEKDTHSHSPILGVEGKTWLHASLDMPHLDIDPEKTPASIDINVNVTAMPAAAPRRFYSARQLQPHAKELGFELSGAGWDGLHSRTPSVDDAVSLRSFSSMADDAVRQGGLCQLRRSVSSGAFVQNQRDQDQDPVYTIISGAGHRRRKKASHLLKKLTGLGKKKDGNATFESRRVEIGVAV
ncbi:hypothetical protein F1880_006786 [Penicillium rolfsii]|nr:hypothetical protein F1880_006786 [Penicillium rolfsii]